MLVKEQKVALRGRPAIKTPGLILRTALLLAALPLIASCVTATTSASSSEDINSLKHSTFKNRSEIDSLREEVGALKADMGIGRGEVIEAMRTSQTTLYSQVAALTEEVRSMTGEMEQLRYETHTSVESMMSEIDVIKTRLEEGDDIADIEERLKALEGALAELKARLEAGLKGAGRSQDTASAGGGPEAMYKQAHALFEQRKYSEARDRMRDFYGEYPSHSLSGNALFWIGETWYIQKKYDNAILSYQDVIDKHPKSRKVPAALLKQAYAFLKTGDAMAAKGILSSLIKAHPGSKEAKSAARKLDELK